MIPTELDETYYKTLQEALPKRQFQQVTIGPPEGLEDEIGDLPVVVSKGEDGLKIHTFWRPEEGELEVLQKGGVIELTLWASNMPPISADIWGGQE